MPVGIVDIVFSFHHFGEIPHRALVPLAQTLDHTTHGGVTKPEHLSDLPAGIAFFQQVNDFALNIG
jgi:hypothetical protein